MAKIFYDHIVKIEELTIELDNFELTIEEKNEFIELIDNTFHHHALKIILDNLPKEHHEVFLDRFVKSPHDLHLLDFLKEKSNKDIEKEIEEESKKVKKELLEIIKSSKKGS